MITTDPLPFCFRCGYDLTGLELPRPCPECGTLNDPQADADAARAWFADIRRVLKGIIRPSTIPPGVLYSLTDAESTRIARRRRFRWLWLPAILTTVLVAVGVNVIVWYELEYTFSLTNMPPRIMDQTESLFSSNSSFFASGWIISRFANPGVTVAVIDVRYVVALATRISLVAFYFAFGPWLLLLVGYSPANALSFHESRRSLARRNVSAGAISKSIRNLSVLGAAPCGILLWTWFALAIVLVVCQLRVDLHVGIRIRHGLLVPFVGWPIAVMVGSLYVVSQDRARIAFRLGKGTAILAGVISLMGHLVFLLAVRLLY